MAAALLGYTVLLIFLLTWNPFLVASPTGKNFSLEFGPRDAIRNIILFIPVGYLQRLTGGRRIHAVLLGFLVSAAAELGQAFMPVRTPSPIDLATNTLGTGLGSLLFDLLSTRIAMSARLVGRLALEIPLMGLLYLLVPLLWVNRLALSEPSRWLLTVLLGYCGSVVLSNVYQQWWGPPRLPSLTRVSLVASGWFFVGIGPSLITQPRLGFLALSGIALVTTLLALFSRTSRDQRFEQGTLLRLAPAFGAYLILSELWPLSQSMTTWHWIFGLTSNIQPQQVAINFRLLEHLTAFTVLGYLVAEWRGRAELAWAKDLPRLMLIAVGTGLVLEGLAGFQVGPGASVVRFVIGLCGTFFGGAIYHLQRDHVRFLLGRPVAVAPVGIREG